MFGFLKKKEKWPKQSEFITGLISPKYQEPLTRLVDIIKRDSSGYEERKRTVRVVYVAAKDWFENDLEVRFPDFDQYICNAVRPFLWDQDRLPSDRRRVPRDGEAAKKPVMKVVEDFDRIWYKDYPDINGVVVVDRDGRPLTKEDLVKMGWRIPDGNSLTSQEFAQQVQADTLSRRSSDLPKGVCDLGRMRRIPASIAGKDLPDPSKTDELRLPAILPSAAHEALREDWHGASTKTEVPPYVNELAKSTFETGQSRAEPTPDVYASRPLSSYTQEEIELLLNRPSVEQVSLEAVKEALLKFRAYLKKRPYRAEMDGSPGQEQRYINSYFLYEYLDVEVEEIDRKLKKETGNEQPA